jgi:peptide/nickel transport system permease protein
MVSFLARRLLQGAVVVAIVQTIAFGLIHAAPGVPFAALLEDPRATPAYRAAWRERYGLDAPLHVQYGRFVGNLARGDLGVSLVQHRPVRTILAEAIPRTVLLAGTALVVAFAGGIAVGAVQAARRGGWFDRLTGSATVVVAAIPDFWLAIGVLYLAAYRWHIAPAGGMTDVAMHDLLSPAGQLTDILRHLVLPAATLALIIGSAVARYQRAALLEAIPDDHVRTARAKGVPRRRVLYRHALRNALLPSITLLGLAFPALLGGAVFIEWVFAWPGMGGVAVGAILTRDYPLVLACVLAASVMVVLGGIAADLLYAAADPRLRRA